MLLCLFLLLLLEFVLVMRTIHYYQCRIRKLTGIEQDCFVELGGEKQLLQIRGENINNPVILVLHNAAGMATNCLSYCYTKYFTEKYTMVYWVQRGCGRSYYANPKEKVRYEDLISDLDELTDYLRKRFGKNKIILLGHACGTLLGTSYIKEHSEKVQAFLSVSQFLDMKEAIVKSTERVMNMYKKEERKSAHYLFVLLSQYQSSTKVSQDTYAKYKTLKTRIDSKLYPLGFFGMPKLIYQILTSPDLTLQDLRWFLFLLFRQKEYLGLYDSVIQEISYVHLAEKYGYDYEVPFYLIYGDRDYFTPLELITDFYNKLSAPKKNLIELQNAGHMPFINSEKLFSECIQNILDDSE